MRLSQQISTASPFFSLSASKLLTAKMNPEMARDYGIYSMPQTADNVAAEYEVSSAGPLPNGPDLTVTAGNASGVNDGAAALLIADETSFERFGLTPRARILGTAVAGVPPRIMGIRPIPATKKVLERADLTLHQMDVIELHEAFATPALAVLRGLGLPDDVPHVNPNGGAIARGHPLGMGGARLALTVIG